MEVFEVLRATWSEKFCTPKLQRPLRFCAFAPFAPFNG